MKGAGGSLFDWGTRNEQAAMQDGIDKAVEHADAVEMGWSGQARAALNEFIRLHPTPFTSADVIAYADETGLPKPPDRRAWGSVFQKASRDGAIRKVGYVPHPHRHLSPAVQWARAFK